MSRKKPEDPGDPAAARVRALRLLARREHGAGELQYKLGQRGIDPDCAAEAVRDLARTGWQSDARYVSSLVRGRIAQGYGPLRIQAELEGAGVADSLIRTALAESGTDWKALAAASHARRFERPRTAAEWQKQYRYLAGRGFEPEQIHAVLRAEAPPEPDGGD
ncbi:MAG: regulatory protein RecX [Nevskia sp.]|nr:regulatory protein RecX [Nevskia sp.]